MTAAASAEQVHRQLGIKPATLRQWVRRGAVRRYGRGAYDIDDVAREWVASQGAGRPGPRQDRGAT